MGLGVRLALCCVSCERQALVNTQVQRVELSLRVFVPVSDADSCVGIRRTRQRSGG